MIRLLFLIRSLNPGGAERQFVQLVRGLDKRRFQVTVATFYAGGMLRGDLAQAPAVRLVALGKRGRWDLLGFLLRAWRLARAARPQIVHGYMGGANELALVLGRAVGARVVWGLRASEMDFSRYGRLSAWLFRAGAILSRFADLIIANSYAGKASHVRQGYHGRRMVVVPNGIDTARFRPDPAAGRRTRARWGIAPETPLIGLVARLDPMKDHATFLRAAALLNQEQPATRFVCIGDGPPAYAAQLRGLAAELGLAGCVIWTGLCDDMPAVYSALDVATSTSAFGEGFSNAIGEAMACAIPCVVTAVGDSARIVGRPAQVVPPRDPAALAAGWAALLALPAAQRAALGTAAREHIVREYSLGRLVRNTETRLLQLSGCGA